VNAHADVIVRTGDRSDRNFVHDLGRRSAATSISAVRTASLDDVALAFDKLIDFVYGRQHVALIAQEGGERLGFLLLLFDIPDEVTLTEQAFVAYTAVEPHAQGRGIGRALMEEAEAVARGMGRTYVSLMVTEENAAARSLYDRAGFVTERRMMTKAL
jgi:ribosomal protein S18 acetylase RimI-like enzyme